MKKNILIPLFTLLTSCASDVNDPIVRFWNGDYSVRNNAAEFDKERRVFYVAITRAIEELCVYGVAQSLGCDVEMSMFANEIIC